MADRIKIPADLAKVNDIFESNGFKAYLVGGAIRDMLMGAKGHDWDLATDATPQQVMGMFRRVIPTGIAHGTVTIHIFGHELETTTFRTEAGYTDARHPDSVKYAATIEEDLSRRDFTMNAIAASLADGTITDPYGGREDIRNKVIRTVGNPMERFSEDGLRPVRAIRFAGKLGFSIDKDTLEAMSKPDVLKKTASISRERFRDEFCKMMATKTPSQCLRLLEETGIMDIFIPGFKACRGCSQQDGRGFHEFDVADHLFYSCDGAPCDKLNVRLAAFYHDIGKPECRSEEKCDGGIKIHFHGHEGVSAQKCRDSMTELKFSNEQIDDVSHLVKEHMFFYEPSWSDAAVRRFIIRVGKEHLEDLFALRLADVHGMHNTPALPGSPTWASLLELKDRIDAVLAQNAAMTLKDLAVNGRDLMAEGIPAGKTLGRILNELFETVTDSPAMNERDKLIALARNLYEESIRV